MAAIYQWFPGQQLVATSTLYPPEVDNGIAFSGTLISGSMQAWVEDQIEGGPVTLLGANLVDILIDDGTTEDEIEGAVTFLDATLVEILIDDGTTADEIEGAVILLDAALVPKLVTADSEDNGLVFNAVIVSASMDDI